MALNTTIKEEFEVEDIIQDNLFQLYKELFTREGLIIGTELFKYEFMSRCESLYIPSNVIYPRYDLPANFGVYRGYSGGGMHSGLQRTEYSRIPERSKAKASRVLDIFEKYFYKILKELSGDDYEVWDSLTI